MKNYMSVEERIKRCILLEQMKNEKEYCKQIGILDVSTLDGKLEGSKEKFSECEEKI